LRFATAIKRGIMAVNKKPKKSKEKTRVIITEVSIEYLGRLMKDYRIDDGDYFSLALRLAIDYVPGFPRFKLEHGDYGKVMRDKGGRRAFWTAKRLDELLTDVEAAKKEYGFTTDAEALRHLTKSRKWARMARREPDQWLKVLKNSLALSKTVRREADRLLALVERTRANPEN
jgi:hypothetical protein